MRNCRCRSCRSAAAVPAAVAAARSAAAARAAAAASAAAAEEPMRIHPSPLLAASTCPCLPPILLARLDAQDEMLARIYAAMRGFQ